MMPIAIHAATPISASLNDGKRSILNIAGALIPKTFSYPGGYWLEFGAEVAALQRAQKQANKRVGSGDGRPGVTKLVMALCQYADATLRA
jgi:hypothetical protein